MPKVTSQCFSKTIFEFMLSVTRRFRVKTRAFRLTIKSIVKLAPTVVNWVTLLAVLLRRVVSYGSVRRR